MIFFIIMNSFPCNIRVCGIKRRIVNIFFISAVFIRQNQKTRFFDLNCGGAALPQAKRGSIFRIRIKKIK
ncbi:MAG: hypothetical protein J5879_08705, partial [Clostridia bacterium]|nr:hypothetical protein [Clostridia bacterium]